MLNNDYECKIGDKGQRFEIRGKGVPGAAPGEFGALAWCTTRANADALAASFAKHPDWTDVQVVDRAGPVATQVHLVKELGDVEGFLRAHNLLGIATQVRNVRECLEKLEVGGESSPELMRWPCVEPGCEVAAFIKFEAKPGCPCFACVEHVGAALARFMNGGDVRQVTRLV